MQKMHVKGCIETILHLEWDAHLTCEQHGVCSISLQHLLMALSVRVCQPLQQQVLSTGLRRTGDQSRKLIVADLCWDSLPGIEQK